MTPEILYEGKAKIVYATDDPNLVSQKFKDDATAFDGKKKGQIAHKGVRQARISARLHPPRRPTPMLLSPGETVCVLRESSFRCRLQILLSGKLRSGSRAST